MRYVRFKRDRAAPVTASILPRLGGAALKRPILALLLLMAAVLAPSLSALPPIDRDEARFAQATKQMLETGDFVSIRYQDVARNKKPVGIYWMQAGAAALAGGPEIAPIWVYRLPSVLGAVLAVLFTYLAGLALFDRVTALIGAALLGASVLLVAEGHLAKTDAMQAAAVTAMMAGLARVWMRHRADPGGPRAGLAEVALIWGGLGASFLIKGPVGLMTGGLALVLLWLLGGGFAWMKKTRPLFGAILALLIVSPWAILITVETRGQFWMEAVCVDLLPKVAGQWAVEACGAISPSLAAPPERGWAPPGLYLLLAFATFFPGSLLLIPAVWRTVQNRGHDWARFLIAWAVPVWIVFELLPLKLPHYTLPAYPALALAAGAFLAARLERLPDATPFLARAVNAGVFVLIGAVLAAAALYVRIRHGGGADALDIGFAVLIAGVTLAAAILAWRARWAAALSALLVLAPVTYLGLFNVSLARADEFALSPRLAAAIAASGGGPAASAGYHEASLVFLTDTKTLLTDGAGAAAFLSERPGGVALVEGREREAFLGAAHAKGLRLAEGARVTGFNYSNGRKTDIALFRIAP